MYQIFIRDYVNKLTVEEVRNFIDKNDIFLNDKEIKLILDFIKNEWLNIYNGEEEKLLFLKNNINKEAYTKIIKLYEKTKLKYKK